MPGIGGLIGSLADLPPVWLVGGAVRDLLRGAEPLDLDLAVEGDGPGVARELADRLGGESVEHERFGTATVRAPGIEFDLAATRRERYLLPGVLPEVEPAPLTEDLGRRDFSVNAMAARLSEPAFGELVDPLGGEADLRDRVIRVLHPASFEDDPTRLLRALRYEARLGARMDPDTERLALAATAAGALATVSGPRIRDELLDLLAEPEAPAALERMDALGIDRGLDPAFSVNAELAASAALGSAETGADPVLAQLAALISPDADLLEGWVAELGLRGGERESVMRAARKGPQLAVTLRDAELGPAALHAMLHCEPPEALAVALACGAPGEPVLAYLADLSGVRLEITGHDLMEEGIPASPALGAALEDTLRCKLDGEIAGREQELAHALRVAREEGG